MTRLVSCCGGIQSQSYRLSSRRRSECCRYRRCGAWPQELPPLFIVVVSIAACMIQTTSGLFNQFPSLPSVLDMSALSLLVYRFVNETNDDVVCDEIHRLVEPAAAVRSDDEEDDDEDDGNAKIRDTSYFPEQFTLPTDLTCHWYYHDRTMEGTQLVLLSSIRHDYLALVFAGTDDFQTMLLDMNILQRPFGNDDHWNLTNLFHNHHHDNDNSSINNSSDIVANVKVHAGFDHAVFEHGLFDTIVEQFETVRKKILKDHNKAIRLYTSGHSLGAAAAVLTAVGLTTYYQSSDEFHADTDAAQINNNNSNNNNKHHRPTITTLNFGCPCTGNSYWRDFLHNNNNNNNSNNSSDRRNNNNESLPLGIWRFVLGHDLVPRLPELFYHVGHTVQLWPGSSSTAGYELDLNLQQQWKQRDEREEEGMQDEAKEARDDGSYWSSSLKQWFGGWWSPWDYWNPGANSTNNGDDPIPKNPGTVLAYYQHYGDGGHHYAGVPLGWSSVPFIWVPGSMSEHHAVKYWQFFHDLLQFSKNNSNASSWISEFVPFSEDNSDDHPPNVDDDWYVDPPDDDSAAFLMMDGIVAAAAAE